MGPPRTPHTNAHRHHFWCSPFNVCCRNVCAQFRKHTIVTKYWNKYYRLWILYVVLTRRYRSVSIFGAFLHVYTLLKKNISFFFFIFTFYYYHYSQLARTINPRTHEYLNLYGGQILASAFKYMKFAFMFLCLSLKCELISVPLAFTCFISKYARNILQYMNFMTFDVDTRWLAVSGCAHCELNFYLFVPGISDPFCHKHKHS